jgi:hypothetical protein
MIQPAIRNERKTAAIQISNSTGEIRIDAEAVQILDGGKVKAVAMFFSPEEARQIRDSLTAALEGK